jgi:hypothetical protein
MHWLRMEASLPQVVVSDIRMPGESGLTCSWQKVKERASSPAGDHHDRAFRSGKRRGGISGRRV